MSEQGVGESRRSSDDGLEDEIGFVVGGTECSQLACELDEALRAQGLSLDDAQLDVATRTVVRAWLSGYRFGIASVIAPGDAALLPRRRRSEPIDASVGRDA